mmetsp:Transcript_16696/g.22965  ORF Transcript_16696/g.22965 Transcript_16696/m.22965 type:complete len:291 (+) Transcript_16696:161-1033(+)
MGKSSMAPHFTLIRSSPFNILRLLAPALPGTAAQTSSRLTWLLLQIWKKCYRLLSPLLRCPTGTTSKTQLSMEMLGAQSQRSSRMRFLAPTRSPASCGAAGALHYHGCSPQRTGRRRTTPTGTSPITTTKTTTAHCTAATACAAGPLSASGCPTALPRRRCWRPPTPSRTSGTRPTSSCTRSCTPCWAGPGTASWTPGRRWRSCRVRRRPSWPWRACCWSPPPCGSWPLWTGCTTRWGTWRPRCPLRKLASPARPLSGRRSSRWPFKMSMTSFMITLSSRSTKIRLKKST